MEPIEYVRALIRRWPIIAIGALIGAAFAFVGTDASPAPVTSSFTAAHTVLASLPEVGSQSLVGTTAFAQIPVFATTGEVPAWSASSSATTARRRRWPAKLVVESEAETGTIRFSTAAGER